MLREIRNLQQHDPALTRRWFQSDYFDLFIWSQADGTPAMLQLCYDLRRNERAITWKKDIGFFHDGVDDGEGSGPHGSGGNATPILVANGPYDAEKVNSRFMRESADMPVELRKLVLSKLHEYSISGPIMRRAKPRRSVRREGWQQPPQSLADLPAAAPAPEKPSPN
ncbi:MAG: hypothetical protein JWN73_1128 [Betaproteobacteria bacterium]|nr:hypothetical protein [Betaproteobacteria bacterium]